MNHLNDVTRSRKPVYLPPPNSDVRLYQGPSFQKFLKISTEEHGPAWRIFKYTLPKCSLAFSGMLFGKAILTVKNITSLPGILFPPYSPCKIPTGLGAPGQPGLKS